MKDVNCPAPEQLIAWLDGEIEDELTAAATARHISSCPVCQEFVSAMQEENALLCTMLDTVPVPDLTGRVMAGIAEANHSNASYSAAGYSATGDGAAGLFSILSYLVTAGVGLILVLAYNFLPGLIDFELRPVVVVRFLTALDWLAGFIADTMRFIAAGIFPGAPLIPPLILVVAVLLVNLIGKRRLSDV